MDAPIDLVVSRWAFFVPAMVLFGSSLFAAYAFPRKNRFGAPFPRPVSIGLAGWALLASVAWLFALAHELNDANPVFATVETILTQTSFGPSWIARLAFGALALGAACAGWPRVLLAASAGLLISEGWDGHAAAHGVFGELVQALHVLCAGAWIGGLFPLVGVVACALRTGHAREAFDPVRRFSNVGIAVVLVILATGVLNVLLLGQIAWSGDYAHVLAAKALLFLLMAMVAAFNRLRLAPRLNARDGRRALRLLIATTVCEQALAVGVLLAVSALGLLDPYMARMAGV